MPVLARPDYRPSLPFSNPHVQTTFPTLFRKTPQLNPSRKRIETGDGDFLDIDHHFSATGRTAGLAIVSHGLEGHSPKKYPLGMARCLTEHGWDVVCLNFRGCSGEPNRLPRLYHSGVTDDLHTIVRYCLSTDRYQDVVLIGFSMGGNQTLKYLGESPGIVPSQVRAAIVFSVPCMLADSVEIMKNLVHKLLKIRVKPYYIYQCDPIPGSSHFRTPVTKGLEIIQGLRGFTSGYAIPHFVIDAPGGGGKIPLLPEYYQGRDGDQVVLKNFSCFSVVLRTLLFDEVFITVSRDCSVHQYNAKNEGIRKGRPLCKAMQNTQ